MQKIVFLFLLITAPDVFAASKDAKKALAEPGACVICHAEYAEPKKELCADCLDCLKSRTGSKARKKICLPRYKSDDGSGSGVAAPSEEGESATPEKGPEVLPMPLQVEVLPQTVFLHQKCRNPARKAPTTGEAEAILRCPYACPFTTNRRANLLIHVSCHHPDRLSENPGYVRCTKPGCGFITAACRMAPHEKLPHPPAAQ